MGCAVILMTAFIVGCSLVVIVPTILLSRKFAADAGLDWWIYGGVSILIAMASVWVGGKILFAGRDPQFEGLLLIGGAPAIGLLLGLFTFSRLFVFYLFGDKGVAEPDDEE